MYHLLYLLFTTVTIHSVVPQLNEQRVKENMVINVKRVILDCTVVLLYYGMWFNLSRWLHIKYYFNGKWIMCIDKCILSLSLLPLSLPDFLSLLSALPPGPTTPHVIALTKGSGLFRQPSPAPFQTKPCTKKAARMAKNFCSLQAFVLVIFNLQIVALNPRDLVVFSDFNFKHCKRRILLWI